MDTVHAAYAEVYVYTMGPPGFIFQHVVDTSPRKPRTNSRPNSVVFDLGWPLSPRGATVFRPSGPKHTHGPLTQKTKMAGRMDAGHRRADAMRGDGRGVQASCHTGVLV